MLWFRKRQIQKNSPCRILPTLKKSCMPPLRSSTVPHCFYLSLQATSPGFIYQEASCGDRDDECNVGRNIIEAHKVSWQGGAFLGKLKTKYRDSSQNPASQHFHLDFHRHRLLTLSSQHQYIHCVHHVYIYISTKLYILWTAYLVLHKYTDSTNVYHIPFVSGGVNTLNWSCWSSILNWNDDGWDIKSKEMVLTRKYFLQTEIGLRWLI